MNNKQPRVIFHKLSNSKSKEKSSPYKQFKIKHKNQHFVENFNKLEMRQTFPNRQNIVPQIQPLRIQDRLRQNVHQIRQNHHEVNRHNSIKILGDRTKPKMKLTLDKKHHATEPLQQNMRTTKDLLVSKQTLNTFLQTQNISIYNQLLYKIQQQTHMIKLHFKEIKKSIKTSCQQQELNKDNKELKNTDEHRQSNDNKSLHNSFKESHYQENYNELIGYLQELKKNNGEVQLLKHIIVKYQEEIVSLKQEINLWQERYSLLEKQLDQMSLKNSMELQGNQLMMKGKQESHSKIDRLQKNMSGSELENLDRRRSLSMVEQYGRKIQQKLNEINCNQSKKYLIKDRNSQSQSQEQSFQSNQSSLPSINQSSESKTSMNHSALKTVNPNHHLSQKRKSEVLYKEVIDLSSEIRCLKKQYNELKYVNTLLYDKINELSLALEQKDQEINKLRQEISSHKTLMTTNKLKKSIFSEQKDIFIAMQSQQMGSGKNNNIQISEIDQKEITKNERDNSGQKDDLNLQMQQEKSRSSVISQDNNNDDLSIELSVNEFFNRAHKKHVTFAPSADGSINNVSIDLANNNQSLILRRSMSQNMEDSKLSLEGYGLIECPKLTKKGESIFRQSFSKMKRRQSTVKMTAKQRKKMLIEKEINHIYSADNMKNLTIISRTIYLKMKAFKQTFAGMQAHYISMQLLELNKQQMEQILNDYPFYLHDRLIFILMKYIMTNPQQLQQALQNMQQNSVQLQKSQHFTMTVDMFINKLRQFIPQITCPDDQEQSNLILNLKKFLLKTIDQLQEEYQKIREGKAFISEQELTKLLKSINCNQEYIQFIVCQCIIISVDVQNLNFDAFLSIYGEQ